MRKVSYFKIGLFVIGAVTLSLIAVIYLGVQSFFQKRYLFETYFEQSVQGLEIGSPVKFRGFRIGRVEEIALAGKEYVTEKRYVIVRSSLRSEALEVKSDTKNLLDLKNEVSKGLRCRMGFQGLTGSGYLELDYVEPKRSPLLEIEWIPTSVYIPSVPSTIARLGVAIDKIMRQLEKFDFSKFSASLQKSFGSITKALENTNIQQVAQQAERLLLEVRKTNRRIYAILESKKVESMLTDASAAMASFRKLASRSEEPLVELLSSLKKTSEEIGILSKRVESVSGDVPQSITKFRDSLDKLNRLITKQQEAVEVSIQNIRLFSQDIRELSDDVTKYPSQLLFGEPPPRAK